MFLILNIFNYGKTLMIQVNHINDKTGFSLIKLIYIKFGLVVYGLYPLAD